MNTNLSALAATPEVHTLVAAVRIRYIDDLGVTSYIRVCNWIKATDPAQQLVIINEPTFGEQAYNPYPFDMPEINVSSDKDLPTISLSFPITDLLYGIVQNDVENLTGQEVAIFITNKELLDINTNRFIQYKYYIDSIGYNDQLVVLNLAVKYDVNKVTVPRRRFKRNYCPWKYRDGKNCPYNPLDTDGTWGAAPYNQKFWDAQGDPIEDTGQGLTAASESDHCGKSLSDCKLRRKATKVFYNANLRTEAAKIWWKLPFGGFPAVPNRDPRKF